MQNSDTFFGMFPRILDQGDAPPPPSTPVATPMCMYLHVLHHAVYPIYTAMFSFSNNLKFFAFFRPLWSQL